MMSGDVETESNYLINTTDGGPAWLKFTLTSAYTTTNYGHEPTRVTIHGLWGKETSMNLGMNEFEVIKYEDTIQKEFEDNSEA